MFSKRINRQILFVFCVVIIGIFFGYANAQNTLTLPDIQVNQSETGVFGLNLTNQDAVATGQFVFTYNSSIGFTITGVNRTTRTEKFDPPAFDSKISDSNNVITVLLYSFSGASIISVGNGNILEFTYQTTSSGTGSTALTFTEPVLSDQNGEPLQVVTQDGKITVGNPSPTTYTLTKSVSPSSSGTVSANPDKTAYNSGERVTLAAIPNSGYRFVRWEGAATGTNSSIQVTVNSNLSVSAVFETIPANTYTLSKSVSPSSSGTISASPDKTAYNSDESVTLTATPSDSCYEFANWSEDYSGTDSTITLTIDSNKTVTANFRKKTYSLTVNATNGAVTKSPNMASYECGSSVTLEATPNSGYRFARWEGGVTGTDTSITVTINSSLTVNAVFEVIPQTGSLKVTISPQNAIKAGAQWKVVGEDIWRNSEETLENLTPGKYTVAFKKISDDWTEPANQEITVNAGQSATITGTYIPPVCTYPKITTTEVTSITQTTATAGGNVIEDGDCPVIARGVCWNTSRNPLIEKDEYITNGTGTGSFTISIVGLNPDTIYYIRAYATNSRGTTYGGQYSFTTLSISSTVPTVITDAITGITATTATCGGNITSDGGSAVTARGVCWGIYPDPTTDNNKTSDGTGTGSFTSSIVGLNPDTVYYIRAYATNSGGTAYGVQLSFKTTLSTTTVLSVTPDLREVTATNGITTFEVSNVGAGTMDWTATSTESWLKIISGDSGGNTGTITVSYEENSGAQRIGTIIVQTSDAKKTLQIIQDGSEPKMSLSVSPAYLYFSASGDKMLVEIANTGTVKMDWTVSKNAEWFTVTTDSGTDNGVMTVECGANDSGVERTGIITVTAEGAKNSPQYIEIKQSSFDHYAISGYIKDSSGKGINEVTLTFTDSTKDISITTDTSGYYNLELTSGWTGTVTPSKSGYSFIPENRSYSNVTSNQTDQNYIGISDLKPNLACYKPSDWSDKIVVSNKTGTTIEPALLCATDELYVNIAYYNNGTTKLSDGFDVEIYVDGIKKATVKNDALEPSPKYGYIKDYSIGNLSAGTHIICMKIDPANAIDETDESDNECCKIVTIASCSTVNLTCFKPQNWSDKIVISNKMKTSTDDSPLYATDDLYADIGYYNDGTTTLPSGFDVEIYIDGIYRISVENGALEPYPNYGYAKDYFLGRLSEGTHTISVKIDPDNIIAETDESDNECSKTFTVESATLIQDGSFEAGSPNIYWNDSSTLFESNIYQDADMAHSGDWLVWFAGGNYYGGFEVASVDQNIIIPKVSSAMLQFWLQIHSTDVFGFLTVSIDEQTVFMTDTYCSDYYDTECPYYYDWAKVTADISQFADGNMHNLKFDVIIIDEEGSTDFLVDDISLSLSTSPTVTPCDLDGDGNVNLADAIIGLKILCGINFSGFNPSAEINGDGKIGLEEVLYILQKVSGVE